MQTSSYLVTGASTGIGRATVDKLVHLGAHVWATVRSDVDERSLKDAHGEKVSVLRVDVTDLDSVKAAGEAVVKSGPLNGLVNNAGVALPAPLEHLPIETFRKQLEVNLVGQLAVTQAMLPALRKAKELNQTARIVMIGSIGGRIAGPVIGAYHASKFGLVGLTDSLRAELAPSGIGVFLIEPGAISTPIWERSTAAGDPLMDTLSEQAQQIYAKQIAAARANAASAPKRGIPPQRAANLIAKVLTAQRPRPRYLLGPDAHIASIIARLPYRLRYKLTAGK
jgi:NAD(P)-dependent dehydrogenase (short-subunit alcohol dehydrogenase family)